MAQEVLTHLKEHPDAWTRVDTILEFSQNMNTKVSKWWFKNHYSFLPVVNFEEGISFLVLAVVTKSFYIANLFQNFSKA
jgi:hypothetical protein